MGAQPGLNNEARNSERDLSQNCHHWSDQAGNYLSATGLPQKYLGRHRHLSGLIVTSRVPIILVNLRNCRSFGKQTHKQGGITCGAIDELRKSSKTIDERVIINFRDKNVVIACFRDKNVYR